jgi:hypothetical protein
VAVDRTVNPSMLYITAYLGPGSVHLGMYVRLGSCQLLDRMSLWLIYKLTVTIAGIVKCLVAGHDPPSLASCYR